MQNICDEYICPICGACNNEILFNGINADNANQKKIPIIKCQKCTTTFSSLNNIDSKNLYFDGYYGEKARDSIINTISKSVFYWERKKKALKGCQSGVLLDFGCGDGSFLQSLSNEWMLYGYEPNIVGAQLTGKIDRINFLSNLDDVVRVFNSNVDVVTLWQSFEHISEPKIVLGVLYHCLAENGRLFISVPNFSSLQAKIFKARWFHLDPTRHCVHYSPHHLMQLLKSSGYKCINYDTLSIEYGLFGWLQSFLNICTPEFNWLYKKLKARNRNKTINNEFVVLIMNLILIPPLLFLSIIMFVGEVIFRKGGVINMTFTKEKKFTT
jgi:2-polyprenyl-3-methyl-5-hydroxy-6-metoxy-1,4-benzoquinol methylase